MERIIADVSAADDKEALNQSTSSKYACNFPTSPLQELNTVLLF